MLTMVKTEYPHQLQSHSSASTPSNPIIESRKKNETVTVKILFSFQFSFKQVLLIQGVRTLLARPPQRKSQCSVHYNPALKGPMPPVILL